MSPHAEVGAQDCQRMAVSAVFPGRSACTHAPAGAPAGQVIWPAAQLLAAYLADNPHWAQGRNAAVGAIYLSPDAGRRFESLICSRHCPRLTGLHMHCCQCRSVVAAVSARTLAICIV